MEKEPEFTVNDRRGKPKEWPKEEAPTVLAAEEALGDGAYTWKSPVVYLPILVALGPELQGMAIQAVAMRSDGKPFVVNYLLNPWAEDGFDFTAGARKQLDTFLTCHCDERGPCKTHEFLIPQWGRDGVKRFQEAAAKPVPEALELIIRANAARQASRIITHDQAINPGRA